MSQSKQRAPRRKAKSQLPLVLILGGFALLVLAMALTLRKPSTPFVPAVSGAPSLQADKEKVDLGQVKLGQNVKVAFVLTNVGDQPLRFSEAPYIEVKEGC
jgi:hypothetical protein